ncbi:hypothetical protein JZ751_029515, partial [Albula glossodonta]
FNVNSPFLGVTPPLPLLLLHPAPPLPALLHNLTQDFHRMDAPNGLNSRECEVCRENCGEACACRSCHGNSGTSGGPSAGDGRCCGCCDLTETPQCVLPLRGVPQCAAPTC